MCVTNRDMNYIHRKEEIDDTNIREIQWTTYLCYIQAFGSRTSLPCLVMKGRSRGPVKCKKYCSDNPTKNCTLGTLDEGQRKFMSHNQNKISISFQAMIDA